MKKLKRFMSQYIILGLFVFFLVFSIITSFIFQIQKINQYNGEIVKINNQIKDTKEEISNLKKTAKEDDLEYVARNKLGMVKQGEIIYIDLNERGN